MTKITDEEKTIVTLSRDFAVMGNNIEYMKRDLNDLKLSLTNSAALLATKAEVDSVRREVALLRTIVFGFISIILVAVAGSWIRGIIK